MPTPKLPYNFKPRKYQMNILRALDNGVKRVVWVCHRRAGKDLTIWNWVIKALVETKQTAYYLLPTYSQAKKIVWEGMTFDGIRFTDFIPKELIKKKSEAELSIRFVNGSLLQLVGSDNYDRLVGTNPRICIFSEAAVQNPTAWEYMRPILRENKGVAIFISTPRGKNHFWELKNIAETNEDWFFESLTIDDTGVLTERDMDIERAEGMSEEMIQQEYYVSFEVGQLGSYYGSLVAQAEKEGRVCHVPVDKNLLVYTAWDLGYSDSMSIIFYQKRGNEILIVDHYENHGFALSHYLDVLREKKYAYGKHFAPHDGKAHSNTGTTFVQVAREAGFDFSVLPQERSVLEGVENVRGAMPRMFFDKTKCGFLLKCLLQYHAEWDDNAKVFRGRPKHDWSSHSADCLRYVVQALGITGSPAGGLTKEKIREMRSRHGY